MGNRAVICNFIEGETEEQFEKFLETGRSGIRKGDDTIGVYLHWNGGRDSIKAFLTYCKIREYRTTNSDNYGWARLCQVIGNFFGGSTSIGISILNVLDCNNGDNGVYAIQNWEIKGRYYFDSEYGEQNEYDLIEMLIEIDKRQPEKEQLGSETILKLLD